MMRILFLSVIFCFASVLSAQVNYTVVEDDPDYAKFMAQLGIGFETDFQFRTEIPLKLNLHYDLAGIPAELDVSFIGSVYSERKNSFYSDNLSGNEFQRYSNFEIGGIFNIIDNSSSESLRVVVTRKTKMRARGKEVTNYYIPADGKVRRRYGGRVGGFRFTQSIMDYDAIGQSIEFADGTTFPDADNPWTEKPADNDEYYFTAERHLVAHVGVGFHKSQGLTLDVEEFGVRDEQGNLFVYADMLLSIASDIQKLSYYGTLYDLTEATAGVNLNKIGFRVGMKKVFTNVYYSLELGLRPQYFKSKLYTQFLIGYSFNRNI